MPAVLVRYSALFTTRYLQAEVAAAEAEAAAQEQQADKKAKLEVALTDSLIDSLLRGSLLTHSPRDK